MKKMNRQERRLTWKYFWKQKLEEITDFFEEITDFFEDANNTVPLVVVSFMLGGFFQIGWQINTETGLPLCKAIAIIGLCMIGFWILVGLIALIKVIVEWIKSNWKLAKINAQKELKSGKKK